MLATDFFHVDCAVTLQRLDCLFVMEIGSRYVDHLHGHFEVPAVVRGGRYLAPAEPGAGARMRGTSVEEYAFPGGTAWVSGSSPARQATPWQAAEPR